MFSAITLNHPLVLPFQIHIFISYFRLDKIVFLLNKISLFNLLHSSINHELLGNVVVFNYIEAQQKCSYGHILGGNKIENTHLQLAACQNILFA